MSVQLEFQAAGETGSTQEAVLAAARAAIDLDRFPGFAEFTDGAVTVEEADSHRIVLATDNRWAATAIRTALRQSGYAVEADRGNETTIVTVWAIGEADGESQPDLQLSEERDQHGRTTYLLEGPDGTVEQQCGSGGHNDMIVHARHPFPGSARAECARHGAGCWIRSDWPWEKRAVRSCIRSVLTDAGSAWQASPEAESRMRELYLQYAHQTRRTSSAPAFHLPGPSAVQAPTPTPAKRMAPPRPASPAPRQVDVIRDLSDFKGAA